MLYSNNLLLKLNIIFKIITYSIKINSTKLLINNTTIKIKNINLLKMANSVMKNDIKKV